MYCSIQKINETSINYNIPRIERVARYFDVNENTFYGSGFIFTTTDNITTSNFTHLHIFELPFNEPSFKMIFNNGLYRSNMIILKQTYDVNNLQDFYFISTVINNARFENVWAISNNVQLFEHNKKNIVYDCDTINYAIYHNSINVLEWFKNNNLELKSNNDSCIYACNCRNIKILNFLLKNNCYIDFKKCVFEACVNNDIDVLEWIKKYHNIQTDSNLTNTCALYENLEIFEWLKKNDITIIYDIYNTDAWPCEIKKWFIDNGFKMYERHTCFIL